MGSCTRMWTMRSSALSVAYRRLPRQRDRYDSIVHGRLVAPRQSCRAKDTRSPLRPARVRPQGFASCLSELLHCLPQIELSLVIDLMHKSTEVGQRKINPYLRSRVALRSGCVVGRQITGSIRGQEARDLLFGRIFTCLAVARSQRLEVRGERKAVQLCRCGPGPDGRAVLTTGE